VNAYFIDIDECGDPKSCQDYCENTDGAYTCSCNKGYKLKGDERTCEGEVHSFLNMFYIQISELIKSIIKYKQDQYLCAVVIVEDTSVSQMTLFRIGRNTFTNR